MRVHRMHALPLTPTRVTVTAGPPVAMFSITDNHHTDYGSGLTGSHAPGFEYLRDLLLARCLLTRIEGNAVLRFLLGSIQSNPLHRDSLSTLAGHVLRFV